MATIRSRIQHAWNAFVNEDRVQQYRPYGEYGASFGYRQDRNRLRIPTEKTIISSIYTRLSIDVAAIEIKHVRLNENDQYAETVVSGLNECLTVEANIDQSGRDFLQDIALTLFDRGVAAIVPVDTTLNPELGSFDIKTMRVGEVVAWFPRHVRVSVYNERIGQREEITLEKKVCAIVQNPLYSVMNETNSTLQRLLRKLNLLDTVDEQASSGKLDLIIQLPYVVKSESRRLQAEQRAKDIEVQLRTNTHGIAYTDGTEKITQLNRPVENKMLDQVEYLTKMLYGQLGLTEEIMNGTADETAMINYYNRTIEPIMGAIAGAMIRSFLTKTARTQKQSIKYFRDPFKLVPIKDLAEITDKFTRNEVTTANEIRGFIGMKPSKDPKADELRNSNMPQPDQQQALNPNETQDTAASVVNT